VDGYDSVMVRRQAVNVSTPSGAHASRMGLRGVLCVLALTIALVAYAQPSASDVVTSAARLEVLPAGDQTFDLLTGETVLPEGGTIRDRVTGLALEAAVIRLQEGVYIEADEVMARRDGVTFEAARLLVDLERLVATTPEGVTFRGAGLDVKAALAEIDFTLEIVRFEEPIAERPAFDARAFLLDLAGGDALLLGPYAYAEGIVTLRDDRGDAMLQLTAVTQDDGTRTYRASSIVDDTLLERFDTVR